jgi:hypothetical protein
MEKQVFIYSTSPLKLNEACKWINVFFLSVSAKSYIIQAYV